MPHQASPPRHQKRRRISHTFRNKLPLCGHNLHTRHPSIHPSSIVSTATKPTRKYLAMENCKPSDHGRRPSCGGCDSDSDIDIETTDCSYNSYLDKPIAPPRWRGPNNAAYVGRTLLCRPKNNKPPPKEITLPLAHASGCFRSTATLVSCLSLPSTCSLENQNRKNEDFAVDASSTLQRMSVKVRRNSRATPLSVRLGPLVFFRPFSLTDQLTTIVSLKLELERTELELCK